MSVDQRVWEAFLAGAVAPLAVWLLWRVQVVAVDVLRGRMVKMVRWKWQRPLYNVVSWFGTFLHEVSHATVLLLGGHGIREFRSGVETGHVTPRKVRRGTLGFLSFLAAALAPLYIPPALVLAGLLLVVDAGIVPWQVTGLGPGALALLWDQLRWLPQNIVVAIVALDLATWQAAVVFALVLVAIPGSRPSHVKGSRFHGEKDEGDVAVVRRRIRRHPLPFIGFLLLVFGLHFAMVPWWPKGYWYAFEAIWAVALTGIVLAVLGIVLWSLVALSGRIAPWLAWVPLAWVVGVQWGVRVGELTWGSLEGVVLANVASAVVVGVGIPLLALTVPRRGVGHL